MKAIVNGKLVFPDRITEGNILIDGGRIVASGNVKVPEDAEIIDAHGLYVGPGLIDQHSHGYQDMNESINAKDNPAGCARAHLRHGTTSYVPSTDYCNSKAEHIETVRLCIEDIEHNPDTSIVGIHLEGPYINNKYGSLSDMAMDYDDAFAEELFSMAAPYTLHCTYAPELSYGPDVEKKLSRYGILPAIGHTCAGPEDIERAVANGARICTHLYDGSGNYLGVEESAERTQHPQDCTADILMAIPGLYYELICDSKGLHVTPYSTRRTLRTAGEDYVILITDAFIEGTNDDPDGDVNYDERGKLCGSRLTIDRAARNFLKVTGCGIRVAFKCASTNSARALGISDRYGSIDAGKTANIVFVDDDFVIKKVIFKGNELYSY